MISTKSKFKTSVNIKLDLGSSWIQERYIPTPTHIESLTGILEGFTGLGDKKSHIIVGSYGSGKSMIGTLISNIVSKNIKLEAMDQLIDKFDRINTQENTIRELLQKIKQQKREYIPVVVNGKQRGFRETVIAAIHKSLKPFKFDLTLTSTVETIKTKIHIWEENYFSTYEAFNHMLEQNKWDFKGFITEIEEYDRNAIDWFKEIYPTLTAGAEFTVSHNIDFNEHLEYILKELDAKGYGLFFVYDEFGRFLQSIDKYESVEAMQDLQDIAELADRFDNFNVLFITHRNLKQYFLSYNEELQNEFQRIQGRFRIYHTHSDPATFIRLSSQITESYRAKVNSRYEFEDQIVKYDLFPELNGREIKSIIVENSFPLHPVTMFILPRLANAVAQNERTLFTFLESNEEGGLKKYFELNKTWYFAENLFDYFESAIQEFMSDSLIGKSYYRYLKVKKKINKSKTAEFELQLLKLLTLWDIANLGNSQKLNKEFMSFALNWDHKRVDKIIRVLEDKKLIRYRINHDDWEIFEGSNIDINKKIEEVKKEGITKQRKLDLLTSVIENRFAYPKQYNDEKNMIRYATVYPVFASDISNQDFSISEIDRTSDMVILYVIPDKDIDDIKKVIVEISNREERTLFCLPQHGLLDLNNHLLDLASITALLEDKYFLSEDSIIEEELLKFRENTLFVIRENLKPFTHFQKSFWIYNGEEFRLKSKLSLSEHLSKIMRNIYKQTPVINNESFNRRKISKQQLNAAKQVVDAILDIGINVDNLNGPSKLIYASVVKNNRINEMEEKVEIGALRAALLKLIRVGNGDITALLKIFKDKPFGIREPNIPVLLTAILKDEWKYLMFYHKDGSYINDLDGNIFYDRILDKPENYSFSYQALNNKFDDLINNIDSLFSSYINEMDWSYHPAVRINRILSRWFRSLPKITQKTNKLSKEAMLFKQLIKKGEFEPDTSLNELDNLLTDINIIQTLIVEIEQYSDKHKDEIKSRIFELAGVNNFEDLINLILDKDEVVKVDNKLYNTILKSTEENWVDHLALELVGVKRENWSDATDEAFAKTITSLIESDPSTNLKKEYYEVILENKTMAIPKVELSPKGEIIYSNIRTDLELMARKLPKEEIKALLYKMLVDYYEENR